MKTEYIKLLEDLSLMKIRIVNDLQIFNPLITAFGGFANELDMDKLHNSMTADILRILSIIENNRYSKDGPEVMGTNYLAFSGRKVYGAEFLMDHLKNNTKLPQEIKNLMYQNTQQDMFILLPLLKKLEYGDINKYVTFLHRFALVITKADRIISEKEKKSLHKLYEELEKYLVRDINLQTQITNTIAKSKESLEDVFVQLDSLIGLAPVKEEINSIKNYIEIQKARKDKGLKTSSLNLHCVFTGNPGTGKTTVARLLSKLYKHLQVLESGHLVEVDRSGLIGSYVGQTGPKVDAKVKEAIGGTLFIDEAYSLTSHLKGDYGEEAISILLKRMEDHRAELAVVVAGYPTEMETFINANPGLKSRFTRYIHFPDFSPIEMVAIVKLFCKKEQYELSKDAVEVLTKLFLQLKNNKQTSSGNGRLARNVFKEAIENQSSRLRNLDQLTRKALIEIRAVDIPSSSSIVN